VKPRVVSRRIGLARALSKLGCCSRSSASELIRAGRVGLNGTIRRDPETPVYLEKDRVQIDRRNVARAAKVYFVLNKPRGVVTTASDEKGRRTVYTFLNRDLSWVTPVGRLDKASEGLLLLTNDSEWSARVLAPQTHLDKTYHVQIRKIADASLCRSLVAGIKLDDGGFLSAKDARILRVGQYNTWLEIILDEGKNRHIRRMLAQLRVEVLRLVRVAIGPLVLGDLPKGATRPLMVREKQALDRAIQSD